MAPAAVARLVSIGVVVALALVAAGLAAGAVGKGQPAEQGLLRAEPSDAVAGEVIVRFRSGVDVAAQRSLLRARAASVEQALELPRTKLVRLPEGASVAAAIRAFERSPNVLFAERNYVYRLSAIPNDPLFPTLWGLHQGSDRDIDAPQAWDLTTGSPSVVVAVIDSGVAYDHPDLAPNIWTNDDPPGGGDEDGNGFVDDVRGWDFVGNDNAPLDPNGHGTHVAGTIGARGNNALGVTGVNWQVAIMPLRAAGALGSLSNAAVSNAITYACSNGARIVNGSFGGPGQSAAITAAMRAAACAQTLFVFAAGNEGRNNDKRPSFPCNSAVASIVCVGATNRNDVRAGFSNYGRKNVDLAAPGAGIVSGAPTFQTLLSDGFENSPSAFSTRWGGQSAPSGHPIWGQSTPGLTGFGMSDSPFGNYANDTDSLIRSLVGVNLAGRTGCLLDYRLRLATEFGFDFFGAYAGEEFNGPYFELASWTGSSNGAFVPLTEDLEEFDGLSSMFFLFTLTSDGSVTRAGADLDDLAVRCLGTPPAAGEYQSLNGTSMATPHVAGVAALMLARNPALTTAQLRTRLLQTTDPIRRLALQFRSGGRLNAVKAVAAAFAPPKFARCVVPRVVGKTLRNTRRALTRAQCRIGSVRRVRSSARKGRVIRQSWPGGVWLAKGTKVGVVLSRGRRR